MIRDSGLVKETFEGYHITAELGSHTSSPTFLGERISPTAPCQHVIIKLLSSIPIHDQQKQQDILQNIAVLQQLHHPHILPILAAGIHKDMPYIITEYLPSGSLYERLQRWRKGQPMYQEEALRTLVQVGQALQYAHQQRVIHGYLKPQNVLFNIRNEALVTDFYRHALLLSNEAEETDSPEASIYRAPEQLIDRTSEKSDQYALGSLAYTLFTGHRAFIVPSIHTPGAYYKTRSLIAPRRLNAALPLHIEEAIIKAMSKDPDQRYDTIAAFLAALKLPPATGNREMRETIVALAQIMKEEVSGQPVTLLPNADTYQAIKMQSSPDMVKRGGPATFSNFELPNMPGAYLNTEDQVTLKIPQPYGISSKSSPGRVRKSFTPRPQRTFALMLCLIAITIVFATTLIDLNFSTLAKKHETAAAASSSQTSTLAPIVAGSGMSSPTSGVTVPSQKAATPQSTIPRAMPTTVSKTAPTTVPKTVSTQIQITLVSFFNNKGIGNAPGQADFDGYNYSYPARQLPPDGQINVHGVSYQFPDNGPGTNDNIVAFGQAIPLTPGNYHQAFLLASASWGPVSGTIVIHYTDGSTTTSHITVLDWYSNAGALNTTYRYTPRGKENHPAHIYAIPITLDSTRVANALILPIRQYGPYQNGHIHVFALTLLS